MTAQAVQVAHGHILMLGCFENNGDQIALLEYKSSKGYMEMLAQWNQNGQP